MIVKYLRPLKFTLIVFGNIAVWVYLYLQFSEQPVMLKTESLTLPRSFLRDTLHYGLAFSALVFYVNYYVLVAKYMSHSISRYLAVSGGLVIAISLVETGIDYYLVVDSASSNLGLITMLLLVNLTVHTFFGLASATIKTSLNWLKQERAKEKLTAQRIDAELKLLKSQVHPHFLFNMLNTLYSSAYQSGDMTTADGIGKLSHLLRYMLYETKEKKVELDKEVEYLENYIELQKMRFSNQVDVSFDVEGEVTDAKIAPMLLISLVENAFKHGISPSSMADIKIRLTVIHVEHLVFEVENPLLKSRKLNLLNDEVGGLGIENLRKRLAMLYPDKHHFKTGIVDGKFIAHLELT